MASLDGILKIFVILLTEPSDQNDLYEVSAIKGIHNKNPAVVLRRLNDSMFLMVSSWIRKSEIKRIEGRNKEIKFLFGVKKS